MFEISFQNENLIARRDGEVGGDRARPDLRRRPRVGRADHDRGPAVRPARRVLGISTPDLMRTPEALDAFGPSAFGLAEPFVPVEAGPVPALASAQ